MHAEQTTTVLDQIEALALYLRARYDEDESWAKIMDDRQLDSGWGIDSSFPAGHIITPHVGRVHEIEAAEHIVRFGPDRVLAQVAAHRALLDDVLAEKHLVVEDDCWYTCRAATEERDGGTTCNDVERGGPCDCGRDARVERRVRLLALPYAGRDDFQEE